MRKHFIVSAVKICQQCLLTASASGEFVPHTPTEPSFLDQWVTFLPRCHGLWPSQMKFLAPPLDAIPALPSLKPYDHFISEMYHVGCRSETIGHNAYLPVSKRPQYRHHGEHEFQLKMHQKLFVGPDPLGELTGFA